MTSEMWATIIPAVAAVLTAGAAYLRAHSAAKKVANHTHPAPSPTGTVPPLAPVTNEQSS